jgi:hypothetical protein
MKKSHHKDPTHTAVIGIVAVVAIIGLVLLLVNLASPEQRVGQAGEILKTRTTESTRYDSGDKEPSTPPAQDDKEWASGNSLRAAMRNLITSYAKINGVDSREIAEINQEMNSYYSFLKSKGKQDRGMRFIDLSPGIKNIKLQKGLHLLSLGDCPAGEHFEITSARFENQGNQPAGVTFFTAPITSTINSPSEYNLGPDAKSIVAALWLPPGKQTTLSTESWGSPDYIKDWAWLKNAGKGIVVVGGSIVGVFGGGCTKLSPEEQKLKTERELASLLESGEWEYVDGSDAGACLYSIGPPEEQSYDIYSAVTCKSVGDGCPSGECVPVAQRGESLKTECACQ